MHAEGSVEIGKLRGENFRGLSTARARAYDRGDFLPNDKVRQPSRKGEGVRNPTEKSHVGSHVISHLISHVRSHVKISREILLQGAV